MTFGSTFGRTFSPSFQPKSQAAAVAGGGWWDLDGTITSCIGAYQAKGAASLTASYVNLANSGTYDLTTSTNSVDWSTSAGWSGFSSSNSKYLKTGIKVSSVNMSAIVRMANVSSNVSIPFGCSISSPDRRFAILPNLSGHIYYEYGAATTGWLDITSTVTGAAVMAIAGANGYRNGTPETGSISSVAYDSTNDIYIGGWNANGTYSAVFVGSIQAIAFYSSVLTAQNIADLTTAMNAL